MQKQPLFSENLEISTTETSISANTVLPLFSFRGAHKDDLDEIIKHFNRCPAFVDEGFIKELKHARAKVFADDFFHINSANEFCSE